MCVMLIRFPIPKCQTHAYTRFKNACCENSTQKLLTKYSTEENNKHVICRPRSWVRPSACGLGPFSRPLAQFFLIRTSRPANNIYIYIYRYRVKCEERKKEFDSDYVAHSRIVHSGRKVKCLPVIESSQLKLSGFFSESSAAAVEFFP